MLRAVGAHLTKHASYKDEAQPLICSELIPHKKRLLVAFTVLQGLVIFTLTSIWIKQSSSRAEVRQEVFSHSKHMTMNHSGHVAMSTLDPHAGHDMMGMDHGSMDHGSMDHSSMDHGSMDHGSMDHGSMDHGSMGHGMMKMYFHISYDATILFESWTVSSWQGMLWSCIVIFIMAALYEGLKVLREYLLHKLQHAVVYEVNGKQPLATSEEVEITPPRRTPSVGTLMCSVSHLIQTLLHIVQIVLSYFLMLIFMTYNFYLCLAVAVGAGAGYFFFSWKRTTIIDINEHCH